jgi:hypothetical protein
LQNEKCKVKNENWSKEFIHFELCNLNFPFYIEAYAVGSYPFRANRLCARQFSAMKYNVGTKTKVRKVETVSPPMTEIAREALASAPSPSPSAMGINPQMVVSVVITMGRSLIRPALTMASLSSTPCSSRSRLM